MNQLRVLWRVSALLVVSAVLLVGIGAPVALGQDATPAAVTAPAPEWTFGVHWMQDPYAGVLTNPGEPFPGMRYVGVDVEVVNASDQPLSFADNAVSLRDDAGFSYRSGTIAGSEPALQGRALPGGERARGWVWFEVPEDATLTEILLVPSAPELRLGLDQVASISTTPGPITTETAVVTPEPAATATPATEPVTPMATEPPATDLTDTATAAPAATLAPTSVIIIEGADTPEGDAPAPPAATSTPAVTATPAIVTSAPTETLPAPANGIEPGSTVITADSDANLRDGPSLDAPVIGTIPLGTELTVTGPAVAGDEFLWWPVMVLATGEEGYVAEELLTPLEE